jgi:hypothetical protein
MNGIDYHLLNAIAMKYVITYRCLDFFIDNEITEKYGNSPLLKLHFLDNEKDKKDDKDTETDGDGKKHTNNHTNNHTKKDNKIDESTRNMLKDAPFVKYRKANNGPPTNGEKNKDQNQTQTQNQNHPPKECVRNKFICMGKTLNFKFTQKNNTKNKSNNFISKYSDIFSQETDLQKRVLSYRDFKNQEKSEFSTEPPAPAPQADS